MIVAITALAATLVSLSGVEGTAGSDFISLEYEQRVGAQVDTAPGVAIEVEESAHLDYAWAYACQTVFTGTPGGVDCGINDTCSDGTVNWRLWAQRPDGTWQGTQTFDCFNEGEDPAAPTAAAPVITPAMILNEIRRIGLPDPELTTEPPGSTLVNLDTRFKTTDESFTAEVTLLGRPVSLRATPISYVVDHGDGTSGSTSYSAEASAGDVLVHTHAYTASGSVSPQVTTTWAASFSVAGGPMTDIDETITVVSPATTLDVRSSTPLLAGNG